MIEDMQVRNLAPHTQRAYVQYVSQFACCFRKSPDLLGPTEIRAFLLYLEFRPFEPDDHVMGTGNYSFGQPGAWEVSTAAANQILPRLRRWTRETDEARSRGI